MLSARVCGCHAGGRESEFVGPAIRRLPTSAKLLKTRDLECRPSRVGRRRDSYTLGQFLGQSENPRAPPDSPKVFSSRTSGGCFASREGDHQFPGWAGSAARTQELVRRGSEACHPEASSNEQKIRDRLSRGSPPHMSSPPEQRTRCPRFRSGRSLRPLGSTLNARPLEALGAPPSHCHRLERLPMINTSACPHTFNPADRPRDSCGLPANPETGHCVSHSMSAGPSFSDARVVAL
jgi:hypothetical protein